MDLSSNKRLTRICDVIDRGEWIRNMQEATVKSEVGDCKTVGIETLKRESYRCVAYNPSCLPFERRIDKLQNWNDYMFVNEGLSELMQLFETVHDVEKSVHALEDKLCEKGIKINEKMFHDFCAGKLSAADLDFVPDIDVTPIGSSTPDSKLTPKLVIKNEPLTFVATTPEFPANVNFLLNNNLSEMIPIGPNGTTISRNALKSINWSQTGPNITRKLLMEIFDRQTLASHTLSGKPSPAFLDCNKPLKRQLDEKKVRDLIHMVTNTFSMSEKEVRQAITTKCADENKMYRQRMEKLAKKMAKEKRQTL